MKNNRILFCSSLLFLTAIQNTAQASLINNGLYSTDGINGLDWLDVTETQGYSRNDVLSGISSGAVTGGGISLAGWHYATGAEISLMVSTHQAPIADQAPCSGSAICYDEGSLAPFVSLLGITTTSTSSSGTSILVQGLTADIAVDRTGPLSSDDYWTALIRSEARTFNTFDTVLEHQFAKGENIPSTTFGSFLVRSTVSTVPVPAAFWLMSSGLLGLLGFGKKGLFRKKT